MHELAKNLQRRMKRRAPVGPTGWLRRSIMIEKHGKIRKVVVHAHYAMAVEKGRRTDMFIPMQYIQQHVNTPDAPGRTVNNPKWVNLLGTRAAMPRPFVKPAITSLRPQIPNILNRFIKKAVQK